MKLIDKSAVVAEIKRMRDKAYPQSDWNRGYVKACESIISLLDTLEVKEVDLKKVIHSWMEDNTCLGYCSANIRDTAEHFFELGLKAQKGK